MRAGAARSLAHFADGAKLVCTVEDNGPVRARKGDAPGAFGLLSVRRRLELRYSEPASLRLESSLRDASVVELPLEQGSPP